MESESPWVIEKKAISCDQVAWLNHAIDRYTLVVLQSENWPRVSRGRQAAQIALILELLELFNCRLADENAIYNVLNRFPELINSKKLCNQQEDTN